MLLSFDYKKARSFSLPTELSDELDEVCAMLGVQRSGFVSHALETYLKHLRMQIERLENTEAQQEAQAA